MKSAVSDHVEPVPGSLRADFIGKFTAAHQEHEHYDNGATG
ncbi:hypothetical protein SAMN05216276_1008118 [Streptosporangium subroseum]|uniref:Uncharacterized protein n=1 Tax=Streptosporangium subroseum TaxID=106412 RepID=A0A239DXD2_9ACTN|nr:hypothetical protein [Streptosporangium subroseum]SNS37156.1 hypothetical protein SAMN05216276_1008118 [Streptosporangium subroseum]